MKGKPVRGHSSGMLIMVTALLFGLLSLAGCRREILTPQAEPGEAPAARSQPATESPVTTHASMLYEASCATCHGRQGEGGGLGPALAGNSNLLDAEYVVSLVLRGRDGMPAFAAQLPESDVAEVVTLVRNSWGNSFGAVTLPQVQVVVAGLLEQLPAPVGPAAQAGQETAAAAAAQPAPVAPAVPAAPAAPGTPAAAPAAPPQPAPPAAPAAPATPAAGGAAPAAGQPAPPAETQPETAEPAPSPAPTPLPAPPETTAARAAGPAQAGEQAGDQAPAERDAAAAPEARAEPPAAPPAPAGPAAPPPAPPPPEQERPAAGREPEPVPEGQSRQQHAGVRSAVARLVDRDGNVVGTARFVARQDEAVSIQVQLSRFTSAKAGEHALIIHEKGSCTPTFAAAGGHFNPAGSSHGLLAPAGPHAGDLPNITVDEDGNAFYRVTSARVALGAGRNSLFGADGSALMIHAGADDLVSQPDGGAGEPIACGVITTGPQER